MNNLKMLQLSCKLNKMRLHKKTTFLNFYLSWVVRGGGGGGGVLIEIYIYIPVPGFQQEIYSRMI